MTAPPPVQSTDAHDELRREIIDGLAQPQKVLPTRLFYDRRGSELFERITRLPEYYQTRAEQALLAEWMPRWIGALRPRTLVELGAGSAAKTRTILDAMGRDGRGERYVPVDISTDFLEETAAALRDEYPTLNVEPLAADLTGALELPDDLARPLLVAFLGGTIGNFEPHQAVALLRRARAGMTDADRFLLGVDLRHDVAVLEAAYDDAEGVTAEFNRNLLHVVNREFGANFDVGAFRHLARYDTSHHRIEMHLVATRDMRVELPPAAAVTIRAGESIRTEISCKHDRQSVGELFAAAGLDLVAWAPERIGRYALALGAPAPVA